MWHKKYLSSWVSSMFCLFVVKFQINRLGPVSYFVSNSLWQKSPLIEVMEISVVPLFLSSWGWLPLTTCFTLMRDPTQHKSVLSNFLKDNSLCSWAVILIDYHFTPNDICICKSNYPATTFFFHLGHCSWKSEMTLILCFPLRVHCLS